MTAISFDTLKFVERLTAGGVGEAQARAESDALMAALAEAAASYFPDRRDIVRLERKIDDLDTRLNGRIDKLEERIDKLEAKLDKLDAKYEARFSALEGRMTALEARMDTLELRLTIKLGVMLTAAIGLVAVIVKYL